MTEESEHYMDHPKVYKLSTTLLDRETKGTQPPTTLLDPESEGTQVTCDLIGSRTCDKKTNILQGLCYLEQSPRPTLLK
jgi:hypothetical protein